MLLASEDAVKKYNLKPTAKIVSSAVVGVEPRIMGIGPKASEKALAKAGLTLDDMDIIELNEAFSAQSLACIREMGLKDDDARINPNGGAVALGHRWEFRERVLYKPLLLNCINKTSVMLLYHVYRCRTRICYYY